MRAVLDACDAAQPHAVALTARGRDWSYRELGRRIRAIAAGLRDAGLAPGDRVLFSVRPGADAVALALGIVGAGGTVVFADPGAGEALFRARAQLAAPRWVAAESLLYLASAGPLRPLARRRGLELAPYARLVPEARHIRAGRWLPGVPAGSLGLDRLMRGEADGVRAGHADDEALVVFTSGTTDAPKAVVHTRGSLGAGLADFAAGVGIRAGLRVLTDQLMVGIPALIGGAHWTMPDPGLDPGARPEAYLAHLGEAELLFVSPAALDAILTALEARPELTPEPETIVLGGAPVLPPLLRRTIQRMPRVRIRAVYGMTEILPVAIADGAEKLAHAGEGDPVGRIAPSVVARIDDGELVLAGPGLARGYLAELPAHPLVELRTGDLATLDGDRLVLRGRAKDMFIRGTQNVYPGLYEPLIAGLPGVADAAMAGVPDAIGDDRIVVAVVPTEAPPAEASDTHPLIAELVRRLPGLLDAGVLPDAVVALPGLPRAGRSRKLDRAALAAMLAPFVDAGERS
ncbi:MAG: long-chain fatty acid--CoA ligase [Leifsonia xyli]|nr:MAG: long-chain fatty acid--CoA ligase [Leifsonia xyli]